MRAEHPTTAGTASIACEKLEKRYRVAEVEVVALDGLDLAVQAGEFVALVGASGSGKSTLLNILGGLDEPTAGRVSVAGYPLHSLGSRERTEFRRRVTGFVRQQSGRNLLPYLTVAENIQLPMLLAGVSAETRVRRTADLLDVVALATRADHRPDRMSGGEQQRLAIAIALANEPSVLLADEPTGELDSDTAEDIFDLLGAINRTLGATVVVVTHDPLVSERARRTVVIRDGRAWSDAGPGEPTQAS